MRLFLYGTLLNPQTLARCAGNPSVGRRRVAATLAGWRRVTMGVSRWPTLRRAPGEAVRGAVVDVPAAAFGRLAAYEGSAYRLKRVVVMAPNGETAARTWIAPGGTRRPWKG